MQLEAGWLLVPEKFVRNLEKKLNSNVFPVISSISSVIQTDSRRRPIVFISFPRLAGDMSEPALCSVKEESDLLSSHQWRENSCCRDPHPQRASVQKERLSVHLTVHITGAGEGAVTSAFHIQ